MAEISAWRVDDVVTYDAMRDSATTLTSMLLASVNHGAVDSDSMRELAELRHDVLTVDGYDRGAVAELAARISDKIARLTGAVR